MKRKLYELPRPLPIAPMSSRGGQRRLDEHASGNLRPSPTCGLAPDVIVMGSSSVMIGFLPAARIGDMTAHGGTIILSESTVMIGG